MKNKIISATVLATLALAGTAHSATLFNLTGSGTPVNIPDLGAVSSEFTMPLASGTIQNIWITLDLTHTYVGDLIATLESPTGDMFTIFDRVGRISSGFTDSSNLAGQYRFIDTGANFWGEAALGGNDFVIPPGDYLPAAANTSVPTSWATNSGFIGLSTTDAAGIWTLTVSDNAALDLGILNAATLTITMSGDISVIPETDTTLPLLALFSCGLLIRTRRGQR